MFLGGKVLVAARVGDAETAGPEDRPDPILVPQGGSPSRAIGGRSDASDMPFRSESKNW